MLAKIDENTHVKLKKIINFVQSIIR